VKIYTKTGDDGQTGLFGGPRVRKDAPRIEACGAVDELNALLGLARAANLPNGVDDVVLRVQHQLFDLGAEVATPTPEQHGQRNIGPRQIEWMEEQIDRYEELLAPLTNFVLPGGSAAAAHLHAARAVCRRAERRLVTLAAEETMATDLVVYLNRLSDLLFVLARRANQCDGQADVLWTKGQ